VFGRDASVAGDLAVWAKRQPVCRELRLLPVEVVPAFLSVLAPLVLTRLRRQCLQARESAVRLH